MLQIQHIHKYIQIKNKMKQSDKVNIRPQVTMLSVLKYLEYESWFALAEFIDNSIDSYIKNESEIKKIEGENFKLEVKIEINDQENKITIRDNASGINETDYPRAFRAAEIPVDNTGLSEFGMGMKSAACWFADKWRVTTTALGEKTEKQVFFDMKKIFNDKLEELEVSIKTTEKNHHYTIIELFDIDRMPRGRGIGKIKDHLRSIYRDYIRKKILILKFDGEELYYSEPKILKVSKYDDLKGPPILWKKDIDFPIEEGLSVKGFVAIREKASTSEAGFALFRRGRVIQGSFDNGFRPEFIFGNPNSFKYQRVFGELHLEGFDVSFTKKGIQWDNNLDTFLQILKDDLSHKSFPLLQQADQYRVRASDSEYKKAKKALESTTNDFSNKASQVVQDLMNTESKGSEDEKSVLSTTDKTLHREFNIRFNEINWKVSVELSYDPSLKEFIEIGDSFIKDKSKDNSIRQIGIRLSLTHPFMINFVGVDNNRIEPVLRIVVALGLAEVIAKSSRIVGDVRRNLNDLITNLSKTD